MQDGDTLTLLVPDGASFKQIRVRLGEIDTPESRRPNGERAKQALSDLAFGYPAQVVTETITPMAARAGIRGWNRRECGKGEARRRVCLGHFRKRFYPSCRLNQDVPFGQEGVAHQSGLNLLHRLLGE